MSKDENKKYRISNTYYQNNDFIHLSFTEKIVFKDIKIEDFLVCIYDAVICTSKTFLEVVKWELFTTPLEISTMI
jgi:hypothetical protein